MMAALAGCSGGGEPVLSNTPMPEGACENLGDQACSLAADGNWQVVRCSLTPEGLLVWKLTLQCDFGCKDGLCLTPSGDIADVPRRIEEVTAEDSVEVGVPIPDVVPDTGPDVCVPSCDGLICGEDGCGGSCGECPKDHVCIDDGAVCCMPKCQGKLCGDDDCGGSCGDCPEGSECNKYNQCAPVCEPNCEGKECGPDGCDGECGECPPG